MLIDLSEILSTEGQVKDYDVTSELKEFSFNGNVYVVDNVKNFHLTARNEGKRKASLKGGCVVTLKMLCDRCMNHNSYILYVEPLIRHTCCTLLMQEQSSSS